MLTITTSKKTVLAVRLPSKIGHVVVNYEHNGTPHLQLWRTKSTFDDIELPNGLWEPFGFPSTLSDEVKEGIVQFVSDIPCGIMGKDKQTLYWDYESRYSAPYSKTTVSDSFNSLLTANGVTEEYYLLEKID